jgi:8-oxo-dGTP pyrophosphatase MutT (NUDIX family)
MGHSPLFDLTVSRRASATGKTGDFWILEARDWVTVVPVTRAPSGAEGFLMVRQYRHGAEMITLEFPAGLVERGEDPIAAAARELAEETGYRAGRMIPLGDLRPNPAFMNNKCFTFLAEDLSLAGDTSLDELEELESLVIESAELEKRIGTGELVNALTYVALALYRRYRTISA